MNHINKIKEIINSEKDIASKELFDAAVNANTKQIEELSKELQIINSVFSVLDSTAQKERKPAKNQTKHNTNKKSTKEKNPITDAETTVIPITENLTNKRPVSIEMDGKTELVNSFRSLTETACRMAYNKDSSKFIALCENPNVNGDRHLYFAKNNKEMSDPAMIGSGRNAVYVDVAKLAINNMYFLKKALSELGYNLENIKVAIDPNYSRKPREKKHA